MRFNCSGRRLVDVVQVQVAHVRCPGTRPHLHQHRNKILVKYYKSGAPITSLDNGKQDIPAVVGQSYPHCLGPLL